MGFLIDAVTQSVQARRGRPGDALDRFALLTDVVVNIWLRQVVRIYDNTGSMQACY